MGSLFDGIGGFPLAAIHNGVVPLWASEIEPFPIRVTQERLPGMLHFGDITKLRGDELPPWTLSAAAAPVRTCPWLERGRDLPVSVPAYLWNKSGS